MEFLNRLTNDDLSEIFKLFMTVNEDFVSLKITKYPNSIFLDGIVQCYDSNKDEIYECEDRYELTDYNVTIYTYQGDVNKSYREYMYKKFGNEYAKNYLFSK